MKISLFPCLHLGYFIYKVSDIYSAKLFSKLKYFHPSGEILKDGVYIYKGFFLGECYKNSRSFNIELYSKENLDKKGKFQGGIILFPESMVISTNEITRKVNLFIPNRKNDRSIFRHLQFKVNKSFFGKYISPTGFTFGKESITVEIKRIKHGELLKLTDCLYRELNPGCVVVKDFNKNKFYYKEI